MTLHGALRTKRAGKAHPGQGPGRGALRRVVIFTTIWSSVVSVFGLVAISPTVIPAVRGSGALTIEPDGSSSLTLRLDELGQVLVASPMSTLATSVASVLATVLTVWVMHRFFGGRALLDLGLQRRPGWLREILIGLALGPLIFLVVVLTLVTTGWADADVGTLGLRGFMVAVASFLLVSVSEEVAMRGWIFQTVEGAYGTTAAILTTSAAFAIVHVTNPGFGLMASLGLFAAGLLFAQAYLVTRQLWLPIALHLSWNVGEGPLFGLPVSGLQVTGVLAIEPSGPELATGGAFGPEAGPVVLSGIGPAAIVLRILSAYSRAARSADDRR